MASIVVREFEYLAPVGGSSITRKDVKRLSEDSFNALKKFVLTNQSAVEAGSYDIMRLCSHKGIGEALQVRNYVGVIGLKNGLQIEILPKIDVEGGSGNPDDNKVREIFLKMLASLNVDRTNRTLGHAHINSSKLPLFEIFVQMFINEVKTIVQRGLKSSYVDEQSNEKFLKGKILFAQDIKANTVHRERTYIEYSVFSTNRPENKLLKSTTAMLIRKSNLSQNKRDLKLLLAAFEGVEESNNYGADFGKCIPERNTVGYERALSWARVFLKGESFSVFDGSEVAQAILFPMERLFEDYVASEMRKAARRSEDFLTASAQVTGKHLFAEGVRRINLRPDIVLKRSNHELDIVLDTKWKVVTRTNDIAVSDMYQMYAYGRRYRKHELETEHQKVVLIYPWHIDAPRKGFDTKAHHRSEDGVEVDVFYFNLADNAGSINALFEGLIGS